MNSFWIHLTTVSLTIYGLFTKLIFDADIKYETKHIQALIDNFDFSSNATYTQRYLVNSGKTSKNFVIIYQNDIKNNIFYLKWSI